MHGSDEPGEDHVAGRGVLDEHEWRTVARALRLSARELQIVKRLFDDEPEAIIADDLGISAHTVHTHLERLYHKLDVGSRCAVVVRVFGAFRASCESSRPVRREETPH